MITSFLGDGAVILFGLPQATPNDAFRAAQYATGLCVSVERWLAALPESIRSGLGFKLGAHFGTIVAFVTHDLGEALTLADRIILFSAWPGMIKDMFEVDFARPRDAVKVRETPRYAELFQHIWHSLGEEFVKGRRP
jgi:class 3 adenylate cyclase